MKRVAIVLGLLVLLLGAVGLYLRLFSGDPVIYIGGGWLSGELDEAPVADWSFIPPDQHNIDVESRSGWLPYSARPWFIVIDGKLYLLLPSLFGDGLKKRIDADPKLRVRVEGKLHPVVAVAVEADAADDRLLAPILRRQMAVEIGGEIRRRPSPLGAEMWVFRLDSR